MSEWVGGCVRVCVRACVRECVSEWWFKAVLATEAIFTARTC